MKHQEVVRAFLPECIPVINENLLTTSREQKELQKERTEFLKKRREYTLAGCEFMIDVGKSFLGERWQKLKQQKGRLIRDLYFANKKGDEHNLGNNFFEKVEMAHEIPILEVISSRIQTERAASDRHKAKCPLHEDKNPSLTIYTETNSWYCFSCSQGGSPIDFIMKYLNCDFKSAIKELIL